MDSLEENRRLVERDQLEAKNREREIAKEAFRKGRVAELTKHRDKWHRTFRSWDYLHFGLGLAGIILSTTIAAKPKFFGLGEDTYGMLAYLLALTTAIFTFLNPGERGIRYRRAWAQLNASLTRYFARRGDIDDVLKSYTEGEALIHDGASSARPPSPPGAAGDKP